MPTWVYNICFVIYQLNLHKRNKEWSICLLVKPQKKWGITQRRVAIYCKEGRFEGAILKGRTWLIPGNVDKPQDPRKTRKIDK